jgi:DNA polymerase III, delta subunit
MTHHALLYRAPAVSRETAVSLLPLLAATEVEYVEVAGFGIDDVRALTMTAYRTPSVGGRLGVVVILQSMTVEAEQALLKLLEEPPLTTAFLFCVPESVFILPTLLSRFSVVGGSIDRPLTPTFVEFVSLSIPARITLVGEKLTAKDTDWQQEMKQGLLAYLTKQTAALVPPVVATLYYVAEHLLTRGASNKQLFEELAFTLPFKAESESGTLYK